METPKRLTEASVAARCIQTEDERQDQQEHTEPKPGPGFQREDAMKQIPDPEEWNGAVQRSLGRIQPWVDPGEQAQGEKRQVYYYTRIWKGETYGDDPNRKIDKPAFMATQPKPTSGPWRRLLRFSVRGLIVLVLVIGAGLGWLVHLAHIQRDAVQAVRNVGGTVSYDWEWTGEKSIPGGKPWAPQWLTDRIGIDYFGHVTVVVLSDLGTDATIEHVGRLRAVERLYLDQSFVTDSGLAHLHGLDSLSVLLLVRARIGDTGLAHLEGLRGLSTLALDETHVTDAGLAHLKDHSNLSFLSLSRARITDAGIVHLEGLKKLTALDLGGTRITDAGLAHLKGLTNLTNLSLADTQVTDNALPQLKLMTKLSSVGLGRTRVTSAGINELKQALPNAAIH
jgi:hypothetical protein